MTPARGAAVARVAACIALALWIAAPLALRPGMPLFSHDWIWSPYAARTLWTWHFLVSAWAEVGVGEPNSAISANPAAWWKVVPALFLDGRGSQLAFLVTSLALALLGVRHLARHNLGLDEPFAWVAVGVFAASPFLFAKIASGQSSYWPSVAAFVWGVSFADDALARRSVRLGCAAAAWFAVATLQVQFLPFAWIALALLLLVRPSWRAAGCAVLIALGSLVLAAPELSYLALRGPEGGASISPSYEYWRLSQSVDALDAVATLGYAAKYAERAAGDALPFVRDGAWLAIALGVLGAVLRPRRAVFALAALGYLGWAWICGVDGPFAGVWTAALTGIPQASFLREFFHGAVLYALPLALLAANGAQALGDRLRVLRVPALGLACAAIVAFGWATWTGGLGRVLPAVVVPDDRGAIASLGPAVGGRTLFLPARQPIALAGAEVGGDDGGDWVDSARLSAYEFYLEPAVAASVDALARGDARVQPLLERLGVDTVVTRPWLVSLATNGTRDRSDATLLATAPVRPIPGAARGERLYSLHAFPRLATATTIAPLLGDLSSLAADRDVVYADVPGSDASGALAGRLPFKPDPSLGWIGRRDAPVVADAAPGAPAYGVVTTRPGATLTIAAARAGRALVWAPQGVDLDGKPYLATRPAWLELPQRFVARARGPAAIYETGETVPAQRTSFPAAQLRDARQDAPWHYRATLESAGRAAIVLRERYDPAWTLEAPGLRVLAHERADGYANLWIVEGRGTFSLALGYGYQPRTFALLAFSLVAFVALVAFAMRREGTVTRPRGSSSYPAVARRDV